LEASEFRKAAIELRSIWVAGNEYLTRAAPWTAIKTDRAQAAAAVRLGLNLVHVFAHLTSPIMPAVARTIHESIQPVAGNAEVIPWPSASMAEELDQLEPGQPIRAPEVLFAKITDEQIAAWTERFGGPGVT
jgi:methionyl-tRNA synthetase